MERMNTPIQLTSAWGAKGIKWKPGMWASYRASGAPVLSVWLRDTQGRSEVKLDNYGDPVELSILADGWADMSLCSTMRKRSIAAYLEVCNDAKLAKIPAEVIFLVGTRGMGEPSAVDYAVVRPDAYAVRLREVNPDGSITGTFIAKALYEQTR